MLVRRLLACLISAGMLVVVANDGDAANTPSRTVLTSATPKEGHNFAPQRGGGRLLVDAVRCQAKATTADTLAARIDTVDQLASTRIATRLTVVRPRLTPRLLRQLCRSGPGAIDPPA